MSEPSSRELGERYRAAVKSLRAEEAYAILGELCKRATRADRDAHDELARIFRYVVMASLLRQGARVQDAEDAAGSAWLSTWRRCASGELSELRMPGYVIMAARNAYIDILTRQRRYRDGGEDDLAGLSSPPSQSPSASLEERQLRAVLERMLAAQSAVNEAVLRAVLLEGMSCEEAARAHDPRRSPGAVRNLVMRFRQQLREELARQGNGRGGDDDGAN